MVDERSAGAVVFRDSPQGRKFLLLHYASKSQHWDFPKGNIEKGETPQQAAAREIKEETGISIAEFIDGFKKVIFYYYWHDGKRVAKEVIYFLAKTDKEEVTISAEHIGSQWLSQDAAVKRVTFDNSKHVLLDAAAFLDAKEA